MFYNYQEEKWQDFGVLCFGGYYGLFLEVELLNHIVAQFLVFLGIARQFSKMARPVYIATSSE